MVSDAFEIGNDFQGAFDLAQVTGHRLLQGQEANALGLDLTIHFVHRIILAQNAFGQRNVVLLNGFDGLLEHGARQGSHVQQFLLQRRQLIMKALSYVQHRCVLFRLVTIFAHYSTVVAI